MFGSGLFALLLAGELEKKGYPVTAICGEADEEEYLRVAARVFAGERLLYGA